jgi:hypothetical protein
MVLETFAALSLTANIVQFIDFSSKLFSKAREVHKSTNGASKEHADLESATKSLKRLILDLSSSSKSVATAENTSSDENELIFLAKDCNKVADGLLGLLEKVRGSGRRGKWESFLQAARSIWKEGEIDSTREKLDQFRTRMTLCLLRILK